MSVVRVAAVQAAYQLMDQQATLAKTIDLLDQAAADGARIVVFPEVFIPGTPIWIDAGPIWDGDEQWYAMLVDQAVVVPGPVTDALGAAARAAGAYVVVGVDEREPHGATIYNTTLYIGPDGALLGRHRKLTPTGSERTVWGMGDGSTLGVVDTPHGRLGGLTCWRVTCRWPVSTFTPRASISGWHPPSPWATAGWRPCATSPAKAAATSSA